MKLYGAIDLHSNNNVTGSDRQRADHQFFRVTLSVFISSGIVLHLLIGLKTLSYFRRISQRWTRRKAGLVLLQFWHGQLGSRGGFQRKPIHPKRTGASSRKLRSDSGWVSALWRLPGDTMKS